MFARQWFALVILKTPVKGNGLVQLAHQLIAAKLDVAAGADDADVKASITAADALIGSLEVGKDSLETSATSGLTGKECDDGNTTSGDGCSSVASATARTREGRSVRHTGSGRFGRGVRVLLRR